MDPPFATSLRSGRNEGRRVQGGKGSGGALQAVPLSASQIYNTAFAQVAGRRLVQLAQGSADIDERAGAVAEELARMSRAVLANAAEHPLARQLLAAMLPADATPERFGLAISAAAAQVDSAPELCA